MQDLHTQDGLYAHAQRTNDGRKGYAFEVTHGTEDDDMRRAFFGLGGLGLALILTGAALWMFLV